MTDIRKTLDEREKTHGLFATHADISQGLMQVCERAGYKTKLSWPQCEALEMILHKIARIINGNPDHHDHWHDIAGYAQLIADMLRDE